VVKFVPSVRHQWSLSRLEWTKVGCPELGFSKHLELRSSLTVCHDNLKAHRQDEAEHVGGEDEGRQHDADDGEVVDGGVREARQRDNPVRDVEFTALLQSSGLSGSANHVAGESDDEHEAAHRPAYAPAQATVGCGMCVTCWK